MKHGWCSMMNVAAMSEIRPSFSVPFSCLFLDILQKADSIYSPRTGRQVATARDNSWLRRFAWLARLQWMNTEHMQESLSRSVGGVTLNMSAIISWIMTQSKVLSCSNFPGRSCLPSLSALPYGEDWSHHMLRFVVILKVWKWTRPHVLKHCKAKSRSDSVYISAYMASAVWDGVKTGEAWEREFGPINSKMSTYFICAFLPFGSISGFILN